RPSTGVRKFLAVLFHEKEVRQRVRYIHNERGFRALLRLPLDLRDFGTVGERLAVARNAGFESGNYRWIAEDHFQPVVGLRGGNQPPVFVALEVRERESIRQ